MAREPNKRTRSPSPTNGRGRLTSPITGMDGYDEIHRFLCSKIEEQASAMISVAEKLQQLCKGKGGSHDGPPNLYKLVFAGPSGCGKTETVRCLRYLLGMDRGYEHEGQFIEVECDTEPEMLANTLNEALDTFVKETETVHTNKRLASGGRRYPRFMLMVVNEVTPRFVSAINSLLTNVRYSNFRLPSETMLLLIFTCNYGETQIREMKYRVEHEASYHIQSDMSQHELSKNQISLLGKIVPFYPLKSEALRAILTKRLERFIASTDICREFGEVKYEGDVKNMLIDKVIDLAGPGCGIHSGLGELFDKIDGFFEKALRELRRKERELHLSANASNHLVISLREIDAKEIEVQMERECDQFIRDIIQSLLKDPQSLEMIQYKQERHEHINALSMHFDMHHLATADLCGSVVYAHQQNNFFNHCQFGVSHAKYARLKEQNKGLRRAIDRVGDLLYQNGGVTNATHSPPLLQEIKEILSESTKHLDDEDSDEMCHQQDQTAIRGRVEEVMGDESGETKQLTYELNRIPTSTSTSSTSEEEEVEVVETKMERMLRLYGNLDSDELEEISLPSDIDESSGEERKRMNECTKKRNRTTKEKLLKRMKHELMTCKGPCGQRKSPRVFNPQLRKNSTGPRLTFRRTCNACRKLK